MIAGEVSTEDWKSDGEEFSALLWESSGMGECVISEKGGRLLSKGGKRGRDLNKKQEGKRTGKAGG